MNLFIIPGNPPALHFYEVWKSEIQSQHPHASVFISPYPRFPLKQKSEIYFSQVLETHALQFKNFHKSVNAPVTIIGHSLGGWMALKLLESHDALISQCVLLYPFLRTPTLRGKLILGGLHLMQKISHFENLVLKARPFCEKIDGDLKHVTDEELRTTLNLAFHEHKIISKTKTIPNLAPHLIKKLSFLYCDKDTWCSEKTVKTMASQVVPIKIRASHGFIVNPEERRSVFESIQPLI